MPLVNNTIIYIAGYGRSGSTLLDMVLSLHPDVVGTGELTNLFYEASQKRLDVLQWEKYTNSYTHEDLIENDRITKKMQFFPFCRSKKTNNLYRTIWDSVLDYGLGFNKAKFIVDSSKTTTLSLWRPLLLRKLGYRVKVIHLIRDVRAVMYSEGTKGSNVALEYGGKIRKNGGEFRVLLSWLWTNFVTRIIYGWNNDYTIFRYEEFTNNPTKSLVKLNEKIGSLLNPPLPNLSIPVVTNNLGISGNRLRRKNNIKIKPDEKWRDKLPAFYQRLAWLGFPVMRWFGYFK